MGLLEILIFLILVEEVVNLFIIINIEKWLSVLCNIEPSPTKEEAKATDPYTKPKEIHTSTNHIIIPKTPTEIRNENFNKLKEGIEYGDIS